ncbi:GTP-binding protein Di-Ras2 [Contarinia nasturtii]|uniref:GTP-binding protein Di-Ras2 n=1 Tax=Contarinia nasturtii TaxID=265458 RepID=UPI0012D4168B|nr:GTP-binding protein Di-Ras2 [Contarinia nasturtii]XP_031641014.1 GTP-binding protein Di-Ras2 [Contarinia nasturtii]XP_031641015.1 GTP-binding protein Di-Ras2 [Contarinia nasturtii]XP_031641016.1 GTP-binding protein Di-Ras2 [Contarinia nasturtii]
MSDLERLRLVILGGPGVGKSCIVKRFLFKSYSDKYRATIEDLYNREYDFGNVTLKVDILDTSGDQQFPAMRRLSIATAHAFMLVYASTSASSFLSVKKCFEEIREQRADYQEIPIVVAGNKLDLASTHREVQIEDVSEWVFCELPKLRVKVIECSAKDDINVLECFRTIVSLSRVLHIDGGGDDSTSGLKRRSSAYVSATSKARGRLSHSAVGDKSQVQDTGSGSGDAAPIVTENRIKPRSRSLIRRSSRKAKAQIRNTSEDCQIQ